MHSAETNFSSEVAEGQTDFLQVSGNETKLNQIKQTGFWNEKNVYSCLLETNPH